MGSPDIERVFSSSPMAVELWPIEFPSSVDAPKFVDFGREVRGVNPGKLSGDDFQSIVDALNKVCMSPWIHFIGQVDIL